MLRRLAILVCWFYVFIALPGHGQRSEGGVPAVPGIPGHLRESLSLRIPPPSLDSLRAGDEERELQGLPQRIAVELPVTASIDTDGHWELSGNGLAVWKFRMTCPGALAMSVTFSAFFLPEGARMFLYNDSQDRIIGAFTTSNNNASGLFTTSLVTGDAVILHVEVPSDKAEDIRLKVGAVSYLYRFLPDFLSGSRSSGECEVNINCPEGADWQKQKRGVVKIYVKSHGAYFWCTGGLMNNARQDRSPYLLTAYHCATDVSPDDLAQWVFYFNYELPGCENSPTLPPSTTMVGGTLLSSSDLTGSDFYLIRLSEDIPDNYSPYYLGWNSADEASPNGVCIHHPSGDTRKISTYTEPTVSYQWGGTANTHWLVYWTQTVSGWGVTEGGSSGCPLFNNEGLVIGQLTGGLSACEPGAGGPGTGPDKPDYFGKFSHSWEQSGEDASHRLRDWLDPDNTGITSLYGMNAVLMADFQADHPIILTGNTVNFSDLSSGPPATWLWTFEGGEPGTYQGQNPPEINYPFAGQYDVSLVVNDGELSDTLVRNDYIRVVGNLFPNPTYGNINFYMGEIVAPVFHVEIFNLLGQRVYYQKVTGNTTSLFSHDMSAYRAGVYSIRIEIGDRYLFGKVMLLNR